MTDRLHVWLGGARVGSLDRGNDGNLTFAYDDDYRASRNPTPLSVSLPLTRKEHQHESVFPWLDNLLPDNDQVRSRWAVEFDERRPTPFALLSHMGADCAGAVQFLRADETPGEDGSIVPVTDAEIAAHLRALHIDDTAWTFEKCGGRWSLGGQQGKLAMKLAGRYDLRRIDWAEIRKSAVELRVDADWIVQRGHEMHAAMQEAFDAAVTDAGDAIAPEVGRRFNQAIEARARQTQPRRPAD